MAAVAVEAPLSNGSKASAASANGPTAEAPLGERMGSCLRDYFLGFVPPHIRRKGIRMPPLRVRALGGIGCGALW